MARNPEKVTAHEVISEADLVAKQAMNRLAEGETMLHLRGYGAWATALNNMRVKIERALIELVEEVDE
jgi:hypothetical protein